MDKVDLENPDASIDRILQFVDYGHASIGGLTGGIAMAIDDISMWLAYKIFEIAQMADGQESSTRYITMDETSLPDPEALGVPVELQAQWTDVMAEAFAQYQDTYARLDRAASQTPDLVRAPTGTPDKVFARMRKNYALDRARYFIPFATKTNMALVTTARMWAQAVKHLASMPNIEAQTVASKLRSELNKFAPRLMRHSQAEDSYRVQCQRELDVSLDLGKDQLSYRNLTDEVWVDVNQSSPPFLNAQSGVPTGVQMTAGIEEDLKHRQNRYGYCGLGVRRMQVSFAWNNIAIAELRDLNRHRTGHRYTPCIQAGVYLPPEIRPENHEPFLKRQTALLGALIDKRSPAYVYGLLLGSQTPFEHSTHGDKFIYEAELRTGLGAHFRYAQHLSAALAQFYKHVPEAKNWVTEGTAEPE